MTSSKSQFHPRERRISLHVRVDRSSQNIFLDSEIMNLSKSGVFIQSDIPVPVGTQMDFDFVLPISGRLIQAKGIVVWNRKRGESQNKIFPNHIHGMGVQFLNLTQKQKEMILEEIQKSLGTEDPSQTIQS